jgi:mycothiol synthase
VYISAFEAPDASAPDLDACFQVHVAAAAVDRPVEPVPVRESFVARLTRPAAADRRDQYWVARSPATGQIVGVAGLMLLGNRPSDLAAIDITVHPRCRRRGIGTALLRPVAAAAACRDSLLIEGITDGSPGQAWAARQGFAVAQRTVLLRADLTKVDRMRWRVPTSPGYRLAHWTGSTPDGLLGSYAAARNAITEAPHGNMSFTEPEWTPERVRAEEAAARARNCEVRVVVAVHKQSGQVAGLTYLEIHQHRPELAIQQDTAVLRAHRGHGLGVWMKAANLQRLAADRPQVREVRTSNAADNEHMLRVNRQVGFAADMAMENRQALVADLAIRLVIPASPS